MDLLTMLKGYCFRGQVRESCVKRMNKLRNDFIQSDNQFCSLMAYILSKRISLINLKRTGTDQSIL